MSLSKKGSRRIIVNGVDYRWKVSRYKLISEWRSEPDLLSEDYLKAAGKYGLGDIADVVFNIVIELYDNPQSKIIVKYFGLCVDGFLSIETLVQIKPQLVADIIEKSTLNGWIPAHKENYTGNLFENSGKIHRPAILILPDIMNDKIQNYDNSVFGIRII